MTGVDVEAIRAAYPIAQVVADSGVTLRPAGHGYLGCCPFHDDTTPSLSVDGRPGRYHCFGCGASGDVIDYIARLHRVGFRDAVAHLTGMPPTPDPLNEPASRATVRPPTDQPPRAEPLTREQAFTINRLAWAHYTSLTRHTFAIAYLQRRRRIDVRALEDQTGSFVVGAAGAGWTDLVDALRRNGVTDEELLALDLAQVSSRGHLVNTLRNRIIVPVRDWDQPDQIAGFIRRDTTGHPRAPKYRNPTHTPVFDKAQMLYQPCARQSSSLEGSNVVVVEGPLDALAIAAVAANTGRAHEFAPVSLAGTATTRTQTERLLALARASGGPLVLAFDADAAGTAATRAWIDTLRHHSEPSAIARTLVAHLPTSWDPADWLAHHGPAGLRTFDPTRLGDRFGPVPPGAEIVALALAEHARTGPTGADPTPAVIEALRPLAMRLPARHTRLLLATATSEMTRSGWNANHTFTQALYATGWPTSAPTREHVTPPTGGRLAPVLAMP